MLFHHLMEPGRGVYVVQRVCTLPQRVDAPALRRAWEAVTARHDVLRTSLRWEHLESPLQEVHAAVDLRWAERDWRDADRATQEERLQTFLDADRREGFDLGVAPLHRLTLLRFADELYRLVLTFHHTILDGRSLTIVLREVFARFDGATEGGGIGVISPPPFKAFVDWLGQQPLDKNEGRWRERLRHFRAPTPLPAPRPAIPGDPPARRAGAHDGRLSTGTTATLYRWARDHHLTLHTIVQGVWAILLWQHSAETDVVFGVTGAGRHGVPGGNDVVGLLINTLPLRLTIEPDRGAADWLADVRRGWSDLRDAEQTPLSLVQRWSEVPAGTPLFESLVVFEHLRQEDLFRAEGKVWGSRSFQAHREAIYPLTLGAWGGEALTLQLRYDRARVDDGSASRVLAHVVALLERLAEQPDARLRDLPLPARDEARWNDTAVDEGVPATLVDLFNQQVARVPDRVAVVAASRSVFPAGTVSDTVSVTYRELHARAMRLAHALLRHGLGPGECVGLLLDRSVDAVAGLVGILEAGGAYMPLSLDAPTSRIAQQLRESGARYVVTDAALAPRLADATLGVTVVLLDGDGAGGGDPLAGAGGPTPDALAYVLYTSGSTGVPKGVAVTHANAVHYARAVSRVLSDVGPTIPGDGLAALDGRHLAMVTTLCADSGNTSLFTALLAGATVHVLAQDVATDPQRFADYMTRHPLDVLKVMSNHLQALVGGRTGAELGTLLPARWLVLGGEALSMAFARTVLDAGRCRLLNHYGPTETTVGVLTFEATPDTLAAAAGLGAVTVPVGGPLANTRAYVVDDRGDEAPVGIAGELLVSGAGVAAGYLNRAELTAERFVEVRGERVYRTGDRVRRLADGTVEVLGRFDDQVKIRGFRVELGEIEHTLRSHPSVAQAVALARSSPSGDTEVIGAVVLTSSPTPSTGELTDWMRARVPSHMVPASIVELDSFPLTAIGKVDRTRLAESLASIPAPARVFTAPRTETEAALAAIWTEVLNRDQVGVTDTFFELGGHSLHGMRVIARIAQRWAVQLPLGAIFESPTIARLAVHVDEIRRDGAAAARRNLPDFPIPRPARPKESPSEPTA